MTWRLIFAAQSNDAVTSYFIQHLLGEEQVSAVDTDECHDEFKVMASQMKHLSIADKTIQRSHAVCYFIKNRESSHH